MADFPADSGPPGDLYHSSDQDESMDTDSEVDTESYTRNLANGDHDLEVDSSIRMEISDNEEGGDKPARKSSPPGGDSAFTDSNTTSRVNGDSILESGFASHIPVQDEIDRIIHNSNLVVHSVDNGAVPLESIQDLQRPIYGLNIPLWQKILTFVPPLSLGRLLSTSRMFHALLTPQGPQEIAPQNRFRAIAKFIPNESIWQASRNRYTVGIPRPLKNKSELEMWQLLYARKCHVCLQAKPLLDVRNIADPWRAGPGDNGLRLVWICAALLCGICLPRRCQQEVSLQLSSTFPSFLIQALPPLFLTQNNDWISESTLLSQPAPPHLEIRKFYYQPHIDSLLLQFKEVKDLGEAAAEEWLKGLVLQRRERLDDAARWEQWELKGGLQNSLARQSPKPLTITPGPTSRNASLGLGADRAPSAAVPPFVDHSMPPYHPPSHPPGHPPGHPVGHPLGPPPISMMPPMAPISFQGYPIPPYGIFQPPSVPLNPQIVQGRPRRSLQEVNEARAVRRHEIERRCLELDPPITPKVLTHMQSFQAALQISFPFTDKDWDVLKPRLLAQREAAEAQESVLAEQLKALQTTTVQPSLEVLLMKDPNELPESDWEQLQSPVRETLARFAEEYINRKWEGGSRVSHENVSEFAPDILLSVRVRYYESLHQPNPTSGPLSPRIPLSLESMKWLYDNKVKNVAEIHQKELFQCNACDLNSRFYGFEGVIQHYAAKHTTALSLGNVIVNWRTEWPEIPPFNPSPGSATHNWNGSTVHDHIRLASTSNLGEYGQSFQVSSHPQQGVSAGGTQHPFNQGSYPQGPPFYGQPDGTTYQASYGPHGFTHPTPYVTTPGPDQGFPAPQVPYMPSSAASDLHRQQLTEMAQYSRDLWHATMGIKELPPSVRIYVLIHHMSIKFEKKFGTVPDILMFLHGLNDNAQMRPIRSLNGLSCKSCNLNGLIPGAERKLFTLPALVNHFRNLHLGQAHASSDVSEVDWRVDMVDLPEDSVIESLVDSNGIDDRKFGLIVEALPAAFPSPLPSLSAFKETRAKAEATRVRLENLRSLDVATADNTCHSQQVSVANIPSRTNSQRVSQERLPSRSPYQSDNGFAEPLRENEYDPSRISFIGDIVEHSGQRRSAGLQKPASFALPPGIISLGVTDSHGQPESPSTQGGYADRLLRHHRGLVRRPTEPQVPEREAYAVQEHLDRPLATTTTAASDTTAVERFLNDLAPAATIQHNRNVYISNAYSPVEDVPAYRLDHPVQHPLRDAGYSYSPPRYAEPQPEYHNSIPNPEARYASQAYTSQNYYHVGPPPEQRWELYPTHSAQVPQAYQNRDRSRSPRRSIPREHFNYDPNMPQPPYEARQDVRWRGESPPRGGYYRAHPEPTPQARPVDSFVSRDAHGRNVRYVAVPVDEYEPPTGRYPPARAAVLESVPYVGRANNMVETRSDGSFYVLDSRGSARYEGDPVEDGYRAYR